MPNRLPQATQLLYSEILQKVAARPLAHLSGGSFVTKTLKGGKYWYHQTRTARGQVQRYLGRETDALLESIRAAKANAEGDQPILKERQRLVAMLLAGGANGEKGRPGKILQGMADAGLFVTGGVLVGSYAFSCYANMLGVRLDDALRRTEDMDFSVEREIEVGINRALKEDLIEADAGLTTPKQINPWIVPFNMLTPDGFQVEFLTTKNDPSEKAPVPIDRFGIHAQPLEFMDYLIEDTQAAVVLYGAGIPVVVPNPARYAIHKIAISTRRPVGHQLKIAKDLKQAASLIDVLADDNPGALMLAAEALSGRRDALVDNVRLGLSRLESRQQALLQKLGM